MWAGLLGCAISAWLQEITGLGHGNGRGRRTAARLLRELIQVPARNTRCAGTIYLRMPPGPQLLATVLPALQKLTAPADEAGPYPTTTRNTVRGTEPSPTRHDNRDTATP